jgi:hypothetical protein
MTEEPEGAGHPGRRAVDGPCGHPSARRIHIYGSLVSALRERDAVESSSNFRGYHVSSVYADGAGWQFVLCRECWAGRLRTDALAALRGRDIRSRMARRRPGPAA